MSLPANFGSYNADGPGNSPYPIFAKRLANKTHFYEIFNQPNITLIDLQSDPTHELTQVSSLNPPSIALNALILATGFNSIQGGLGAISITGLDTSTTLGQSWKNGKSSDLSLSFTGYPNLFYVACSL